MRSLSPSSDAAERPPAGAGELGDLPRWRLDDLYDSMDSPRFAADLERARLEAKAFAESWRGKLAGVAAGPQAG
ncbi:MAG: oligoendopeptidase F, partial [Roseiarcus sp.]